MLIDINCDMGESFGNYSLGCDTELIKYVTSINIACGFHASDPLIMKRTLSLARQHGVKVGAHPGYPDLRGFGRRKLDCVPEEINADILYQVGALAALAQSQQLILQHLKPHGAFYHTASADKTTALALCQTLANYNPNLILVVLAGPAGKIIRKAAVASGITRVAHEAFIDRAYTPEGELVDRRLPGAIIHNPTQITTRCLSIIKEGIVKAIDGSIIPITPHTICIHSDTPKAIELVNFIKQTLLANGVKIKPLGEIV